LQSACTLDMPIDGHYPITSYHLCQTAQSHRIGA
jgi:hypothetical protein